ncbi:hypothetical protein PIB30_041267 [Stylosanthes scabra]|uniref:BHLH domain-containing protein n=1 Tax=Stylosanthes scabra TaxID=79078 RepID=A0ABU6VDD4_9FABA|nr:hypothetical protein [Stylosanthes scabra]
MEQCWDNWPLHTEQEIDDYGDSLSLLEEWQQQKPPDDDDDHDDNFLREILQTPPPDDLLGTAEGKRDGAALSRSRTCILSFDNSTIIAAEQEEGPKKRRQQAIRKKEQEGAAKKSRNDSQILDHIISERKRRQQLTQMFIALSATIPGLKKTDKASILGEAINYVKQLQERVRELEKRSKEKKGPPEPPPVVLFQKKKKTSDDDEDDEEVVQEQVLPDVEARVLEKEKEVLIEIHCEKENGIEVKILEELENVHHLSVTGSSILPFGNSTLGITIIAKMPTHHAPYTITLPHLLTNLRQFLLSSSSTLTN